MKIITFTEYSLNEKVINNNPEVYVANKLREIKNKLESMFPSEEDNDAQKVNKFSKDQNQADLAGLVRVSLEISLYSKTLDNVKLQFVDENFLYHLFVGVGIEEAIPKKDKEFKPEDIKNLKIIFKKYDRDEPGEVLAQIEDTVDDIDAETLVSLKLELDKQSGGEGEEEFEIETE